MYGHVCSHGPAGLVLDTIAARIATLRSLGGGIDDGGFAVLDDVGDSTDVDALLNASQARLSTCCIDRCIDMCMDMCKGACMGACICICIGIYVDICVSMRVHLQAARWAGRGFFVDVHRYV